MHQQSLGYKVEEKIYLGAVRMEKVRHRSKEYVIINALQKPVITILRLEDKI